VVTVSVEEMCDVTRRRAIARLGMGKQSHSEPPNCGAGTSTRIRQVFYPYVKVPLLAQEQRAYSEVPKLDSTAAEFSAMQLFSKKIPGYALASTFVSLGGILNGYVSLPTVLSLTTCRLRCEN
jgi:hypothetical protein